MAKDAKTIREELARPFAPEDLEWRIQVTTKDKTSGLAIPGWFLRLLPHVTLQ